MLKNSDTIKAHVEENQNIEEASVAMNITSQVSLPALENYSLLKKPASGTLKSSLADQATDEINDLDSGEAKKELLLKRPGFAEAEEVNL